jgi:hypothetical protein
MKKTLNILGCIYLARVHLKLNILYIHDNQHEQNNLDQISDDDSVEILDKSPSCKKTRPKSPIPCSQPHKKLRSDVREDVGTSSKFHDLPENHVQSSGIYIFFHDENYYFSFHLFN